jgi:phosphatidylserine decarboxylase
MDYIHYSDRATGKQEVEKVYFEGIIRFLYGKSLLSRTLGRFLVQTMAKWPFFSWLYGYFQKLPFSKRKIEPFIKRYNVDSTEFQDPVTAFSSFNDFFIRKLKPECRPFAQSPAIIPADGRYRFYNDLSENQIFSVKNKDFSLATLLRDENKAAKFINGSLVIARLCPTDCHRFYFPIDCTPQASHLINGMLYSVNPIAIKDNPWIYCTNRRVVTYLESEHFGTVAFLEIGATNVGSIIQTYTPNKPYKKGEEKGYFSFGGSALIMLFEPKSIHFDPDLLEFMKSRIEIRCLIGQSLGK